MPDVEVERGALAARFTVFWTQYPRKVGKVAAWQLFRKIHPDQALLDRMLATLAWQMKERTWCEDARFIPHPRTWLYQGRWEDEPFEPQSAMAVAADWRAACPHQPTCSTPTRCALNSAREQRA